ncbi:family 20 glycosylhydrolase [Ruania zhangjianzhongii]|uniref:family 20 glycosylhydrolase n=1 Tax=Ruania zhangjianzhongii TaxID=2603206 RepID=UPI0011C896C6|nr:family 20 glycosylhydrolase [Ruania zhangjianzhongii]
MHSSRIRLGTRALAALATSTAMVTALLVAPASADEPTAPAAPADEAPVTVPALQQWEPGGENFALGRGAIQLRVDPQYADELTDDATTFATDLEALTGRHVVVQVKGTSPGRGPGVIQLTLDPDWTEHGAESSRITVDHDVTIAGPTDDGVFLGTRSVLQMLSHDRTIPGGVATDWPGYAERSFMVDNGRQYFTPEWARRQIRELASLKYNEFHWHIADNAGFRIESRTHPEIVSPEHWTQEQVTELVEYAARYHIEIIPEIDMPGHMQYALREHPELQVVDADGNRNTRNLDPTNPEARQFVQEILDELIPLFPGRYVHTGGDEFTGDWDAYPVLTNWAQEKYGPEANAHDAVLDFTNFVNDVVQAHGKTMRMWNDGAQGGAVLQADTDIVLEYWSDQHGDVTAQEFLDRGYQLINANRNVLYGVPGATPTWNNLDPRKITEDWDMGQWHDAVAPNTTDPHAEGILGGQIHLWNDSPGTATEEQISGRLHMPLRAMAQQLWDSDLDGGWDALAGRVFAVGQEPQWALLDGPDPNLAHGALVWSTGRERPDCHESMLTDGDPSTRWCGPKVTPQSVVLDLGHQVDLGTVILDWESAYAGAYSVEASTDLSTWTTLATTEDGDGGLDRHAISGEGRYLRLTMTERGTQWGLSLYEIEVYETGALIPRDFSLTVDPAVLLASAEQPGAATLTVDNAGDQAATLNWTAEPPDGVTIVPASGTVRLGAGESAEVAVEVTGPAEPGTLRVPLTVTAGSGGEAIPVAEAELGVSVPHAALADAFSGVSVTDDDEVNPPGLGVGIDGAGSSYSAQALADHGVQPGTELSREGVTLTWPDVDPGTANNVLANGQSVRLDASGSRIGLLAAGTYGTVTGDWVVHYTDGSSETVELSTPDWSQSNPGDSAIVSMPYRNTPTGPTDRATQVHFQSIPIDPERTVAALTLPTVSATAVRGTPALHVFAIGIGSS